ncbi:hypothetical protein BGW80DRAFT_1254963 [Lactifluus volemus]|nr:hypothetical protein BGW80DRAFT_1254963 [Lactifluus volemus]
MANSSPTFDLSFSARYVELIQLLKPKISAVQSSYHRDPPPSLPIDIHDILKAWRVSTRSRQSDEKFRLTFDLWVIQRDRCLQHGATDTRVSIPSEPSLFAQTTPSFGIVNSLNRVPIRSLSLPRHWVPFQGSSHRDTAVLLIDCNTRYYPNYYVHHNGTRRKFYGGVPQFIKPPEHFYMEAELCELFATMMVMSWTSSIFQHTAVDDEGDGTDNGIYNDSDAIPDDESEMGNYTVKARFGRKRTHNEELCVASCGVILGRAAFFGSEGPNGVRTFWMKLFPVKAALPSVLWHDNNCRIVSMFTHDDDRRLRHYFDNCALPVDMMVDGASIRERLRDLVVAFTFTTGVFGIAHVLHWLPSHNVTGGRKLDQWLSVNAQRTTVRVDESELFLVYWSQ